MPTRTGNWGAWRAFFESRAHRPLPALAVGEHYERMPASLARSLAIFQLGESGGGTVVRQAAGSRLAGVNQDYAEALALFVREEHRHANLLAMCVRMLRGELLRRNWTARLFVVGRRLLGLRLKITVLLAAEVVGLCYYRLLADALPACRLKSHLLEIAADEEAHLRFHGDFLGGQFTGRIRRKVFVVLWRSIMLAASVVVVIDHRKALRDLNIGYAMAWQRWQHHARLAENAVLASEDSSGPCPALRKLSLQP